MTRARRYAEPKAWTLAGHRRVPVHVSCTWEPLMNEKSREHRPQSGDRNNNYVAEGDQAVHKDRDRKIKEGEEKMEKLRKRDEGVR